jgi:DNA repair protein RadA/Sms
MSISRISSSPGSLTQVRECSNLFMHTAKKQEIPIIIVGHVNKDGAIAGPKVMEHIVDAVLYFEGERHQSYRLLRAVKNRFGSTNEIGVFEMRDKGLAEVENPSQMLLSGRPVNVSGTCVACVMEGSRPILAEVQALAAKTSYSAPRRMATGFDFNRLSILIAVMEKRLGIFMGSLDIYLNIVGGFRLDEPAADLPVAMALYSGIMDKPINEMVISFGEIGLGGELRSVSHASQRIREAERMGFEKVIIPRHNASSINPDDYDIEIIPVSTLKQAFGTI